MCVIIDASLASRIFAEPTPYEFRPLIRWLFSDKGRLIYGGRNSRELYKVRNARRTIRELRRGSKAIEILGVDKEESRISSGSAGFSLASNDPHVIALARLSHARTLCSQDFNLHVDFKNASIIPRPRGKIYQNSSHISTLIHTKGCPFNRMKK